LRRGHARSITQEGYASVVVAEKVLGRGAGALDVVLDHVVGAGEFLGGPVDEHDRGAGLPRGQIGLAAATGVVIRPATCRPSRASTAGCSYWPSSPKLVTNTAAPRSRAMRSIAWITTAKNGSATSGTAMPTAASRPDRNVRASEFGT